MSHQVSITTAIKDHSALVAACQELGFTVESLDQARSVIYLKDRAYGHRVNVKRQPDGSYSLGADADYLTGIELETGKGYGKILQRYGLIKATQAAQAQGHTVQRQTGRNGSINLVVTGVRL